MPTDEHHQYAYRGFDLRLENGFGEDEARIIVDQALSDDARRATHVMLRPSGEGASYRGKPPRMFLKVELRDVKQPLSKRMRPARAITEGRGYRFFATAGLPVPKLFAFGEQSRLRPRCASLVCTEKVSGENVAARTSAGANRGLWFEVARTLGEIHAAGFVHGDAVIRNFVPCEGRMYVIDLPRWGRLGAEAAEKDLSLFVGSTLKLDEEASASERLLDAYLEACGDARTVLAEGWRERTREAAAAYNAHVLERDRLRAERRARSK